MAPSFPYTYISCPCSDEPRRLFPPLRPVRISRDLELENGAATTTTSTSIAATAAVTASGQGNDEDDDEDGQVEKTFDPRGPRANFSLFPPEHLLYCEECHGIKCARCVTEEVICWYCPGCLFEVPSSSVRSDDNRCSRNCFSCPVCTSQLITAAVGEGDRSSGGGTAGPYVLSCNYCMWSSLDVGLQFESPHHLRAAIDALGIGGVRKKAAHSRLHPGGDLAMDRLRRNLSKMSHGSTLQRSRDEEAEEQDVEDDNDDGGGSGGGAAEYRGKKENETNAKQRMDANAHFTALKTFYKNQLVTTMNAGSGIAMLDSLASPSSLTRIMNLYTNPGGKPLRGTKSQTTSMREAVNLSEGLVLQSEYDREACEPGPTDYIDAVSLEQQAFQHPRSVGHPEARHVNQLWPMSTKLRTKRSKRCAECKHILVKPEFKVTSTRYRIKLVALNYIPTVSLTPLPVPGGLPPPGPDGAEYVLEPGKASQWIMKLTNPLFENVNVSLGSPSVTPGRHGHKVTILCPQFSIGKNGDVWDDALNSTATTTGISSARYTTTTNADGAGEQVAGKVYESGRNWASVVVEVIPTLSPGVSPRPQDRGDKQDNDEEDNDEADEDEDIDSSIIEIPIRVRLEWAVADDEPSTAAERARRKINHNSSNSQSDRVLGGDEGRGGGGGGGGRGNDRIGREGRQGGGGDGGGAGADGHAAEMAADDGKRELAYWMVIGIGRVATTTTGTLGKVSGATS